MNRRPNLRASLLALLFAVAAPVAAQDVRELSDPTGFLTRRGQTANGINTITTSGMRLVDIEYRGTNGFGSAIFDAEFVANTGPYQAGYWWYTNLTAAALASALTTNQGRLIDLETYIDGNGTRRFACIMVPNTGSNAKAWWYYFNKSASYLTTQINANNARIVDLESYVSGGTTYYAAVMIRNTGSDYRDWWWHTNTSAASLNIQVNSNNARIYDLERHINGNFHAVAVRRSPNPNWVWWHGLTGPQIDTMMTDYGMRPIDIEPYTISGSVRYAVLGINNSTPFETRIGDLMRSATDGRTGFWLHGVNGPLLAEINGFTEFEPASTIKTLHHVHAMRRVALGITPLTQPITVYQSYDPANATCPIDINPFPEQLGSVLRKMMEDSDNARTQAVTAYFGQSSINATAAALGMSGTSLNHRLGCGVPALANPNRTRLSDLHELHETVASGYLGAQRNAFYDFMLEDMADLGLDNVAYTEGAALNLRLATINSFLSQCRLAHKGGSYDIWTGSAFTYHRAEFGWVRLPFLNSAGVPTPRQYTFGAFVNDATSFPGAETAVWTHGIPEVLRDVIRDALATWVPHSAQTTAAGTGCGSPTYSHTVLGLPQIGASVSYRASSGYASSLALCAFGVSNTTWSGYTLPLNLQPFGGESGCYAYQDVTSTAAYIADFTGYASHSMSIPPSASLIGLDYRTQWYTIGAGTFRTSNSMVSVVGL